MHLMLEKTQDLYKLLQFGQPLSGSTMLGFMFNLEKHNIYTNICAIRAASARLCKTHHWMFGVTVKLCGVGVLVVKDISCKVNHSTLHPQTHACQIPNTPTSGQIQQKSPSIPLRKLHACSDDCNSTYKSK